MVKFNWSKATFEDRVNVFMFGWCTLFGGYAVGTRSWLAAALFLAMGAAIFATDRYIVAHRKLDDITNEFVTDIRRDADR